MSYKINQSSDDLKAEIAAKMVAENQKDILAQYRAAGLEPKFVMGLPVSQSLLKNLAEKAQS